MNRDQIILQLQQDYMKRREDNLRLYEQRVDEACERCPGLRELLNARHALVLGGIRASLVERKEGSSQQLPNAMNLLNDKIAAALKAGGLSPDTLKPIYTCPICRDEGYLFEPSRHMCTCMERELNRRILGEAGLQDDRQTFENFREEIFSDVPGRNGVSPRQAALLARKVCQAYADSFPNTSPDNLLLTGKSGLGKTYLLCCIAHRLADRGVLPVYTSAYHFLELARKGYMENSSAPLSPLLNAPLLLIDDLGTEPLMQNITITQLFNLLNERQLAGLHTVISTNLDIPELKERYTERIASRLTDSTRWRKLTLSGDDVRRKLGGAKA